MPAVSVIVPVYKVEPYLRRCVDSILAQTYTDFELILVDDGSPDKCGAICDEYAARDGRVQVIHQENGGLSAARNAGIDRAFQNSDSQWLAFVDSDDWVHPRYLELLYRAVQETGAEISLCAYEQVKEQTPFLPAEYSAGIRPWDDVFIHRNVPSIVAWNKLYAKELFAGLRYPVGKIHEDEFLTYKLLHRAEIIAVLDAVLYFYFYNPEGIVRRAFSLARFDASEALRGQVEYVRPLGNRELLRYCVLHYLNWTWENLQTMRAADTIPPEARERKERETKKAFRSMLLRYGWRYVPLMKYKRYYRFAFPLGSKIAMRAVRFISKIKRRVKPTCPK